MDSDVEYLQLSGYRMETEINASFKLETKLIKDQCNITSLFFYPLKTENSLQQLLISPPNSGVPTRDCKSLQETLDCAVEAKQKLTRTLNFSIEIGRVIPSNCFNFIRDDSNSTSSISLTVIQKQFQYPVYSYSIFQREMKDVETYLVGNENKTNIFVHLINSWEDKYLISEAKLKYENLLQNFGNLWTTGNSISMIWPDFLAPTLFKVTLNKTEISHFDSDCEAISSSKILVNKDYLGSRFDPYIKTPHPRLTTQSEITYMIELATTKFQKLWIKRFLNDPLTEEYADVENWIIEATVEANLKKRNAVELMYEIHLGRNEFSYFQNFAVQFDEFIRLLDDFAKANKRAEGTIRGFFFVGFVKEMEKLSETEILTVLETSRKIANERNLLFGVHFDMNFTNNEFLTISSIEKKALNFVNFIIYSDVNYFDFLPNADLLGSAKTFHNYVHRRALKPLLIKRSKLQAFKQDVEVIAKLFWVRIGGLYFGTKTDFATYLESVNYWATLHQFPVYANRVFDNTTSQCCGWWMVSDYRNLSNHDVFFEIDKESHTVMKLPNATANKQFISANFNHHNQRLTLQDHWKTNGIYQAKEDIALSIRKTLVNSNISYAHITQKVSEVFGLYVLKIFPNGKLP
ncbi:unnamed protein product [Orchesella dallaii]|uniref:Uncharacterized protein n=1 Tax=Orchesella dallaii TaxID=48710 RepID=A0ABP1S853_9HEXA